MRHLHVRRAQKANKMPQAPVAIFYALLLKLALREACAHVV